jgi:hypothetical protein
MDWLSRLEAPEERQSSVSRDVPLKRWKETDIAVISTDVAEVDGIWRHHITSRRQEETSEHCSKPE